MIRMKVSSLAIDPSTNMPFILLQDLEEKTSLPIWIGLFEASAIATQLEKIKLARPMTHDLLKTILLSLGGELLRVEVHDLKESTYFAHLLVRRESGEEIRIDARPSDAIALALRSGASIYVDEKVIEKSRTKTPKKAATPAKPNPKEKDKWKEILENMSPESFGKYKQ